MREDSGKKGIRETGKSWWRYDGQESSPGSNAVAAQATAQEKEQRNLERREQTGDQLHPVDRRRKVEIEGRKEGVKDRGERKGILLARRGRRPDALFGNVMGRVFPEVEPGLADDARHVGMCAQIGMIKARVENPADPDQES